MDPSRIMFVIGALWKSLDPEKFEEQKSLLASIVSTIRGVRFDKGHYAGLILIDFSNLNVVSYPDALADEILKTTNDHTLTYDQVPLISIYSGEIWMRDTFPTADIIFESENLIGIRSLCLNLIEELCHIRQVCLLNDKYYLLSEEISIPSIYISQIDRTLLLETDINRYFEKILETDIYDIWIRDRIESGGLHEPLDDDQFTRILLKSFVDFKELDKVDPELAEELR